MMSERPNMSDTIERGKINPPFPRKQLTRRLQIELMTERAIHSKYQARDFAYSGAALTMIQTFCICVIKQTKQ